MNTVEAAADLPIAPADPHGLRLAGEPVMYSAELARLFGSVRKKAHWLRNLSVGRLVRYVDLHPNLRPGRRPSKRYLYAVADVEKHVLAIRAFQAKYDGCPVALTADTLEIARAMIHGHGLRTRDVAVALGVSKSALKAELKSRNKNEVRATALCSEFHPR